MKLAVFSLLFLFLWSYAGQMTWHVEFDENTLTEYSHSGYSRLEISDCQSAGQPGQPLLPARTIALVIPSGADNISFSTVCSGLSIKPIARIIQPAAVPRPFSAVGTASEIIQQSPSIYGVNEFWPPANVQNLRTGSKSGYTVVSFQVFPFRYNPVSRELEFAQSVDVTLSWSDGTPMTVSPGQSRNAGDQLRGWVSNPDDVSFCAPIPTIMDNVDLLVITSEDYSDSFTDFVSFKNSAGTSTELVYISNILSGTPGYDNAEKLRNYILERYSSDGVQHVLLAGDESVVPVRMVGLSCEGYTDTVPVDLYFGDLDGTWDANGDHNYGQPVDDLDLYSDVSVGRALFNTADEAALFVERTMMYESTPPAGDWQKTAMLCGAGLFTGYTGAKVCDSIAVNLPSDWLIEKAYETSDGFTTPIDIINSGTNWVHYAGHGNTTGIYWQGSPSSMMTNSIAQGLSNGDMAGIHHSIACMPGAFHDGECCAEALWHNAGGGAVSVMFNTSYGWEGNVPEMGISEWMCVYVTEEVFQNGNSLIGDALATSKDRRVPLWNGGYDRELYCLLDWHGFHDPTLVPLTSTTGIEETNSLSIPQGATALSGPSPNPASAGQTVTFFSSFTGSTARLSVFDISGRLVWAQPLENAGPLVWTTVNRSQTPLSPGVYLARLTSETGSAVCRLILTR